MRVLTLKRPAVCSECGEDMPVGAQARYYAKDKIYHQPACSDGAANAGTPVEAPEESIPQKARLARQMRVIAGCFESLADMVEGTG